jgi:hypothetical protein
MPDIAAIITAIIDVTIAIPPRVRLNQTFKELYISAAIPDLSRRFAININKGTDISTYPVKIPYILCATIFNGPLPKSPYKKSGPNFIQSTAIANVADASPSGIPIAKSAIIAKKSIIDIVPISNIRWSPYEFAELLIQPQTHLLENDFPVLYSNLQ